MKEEIEVFELYCPACGSKMRDLVLLESGIEYPEKQCPKCKTIYQLASEEQGGTQNPQQIILVPHDKAWLKKNGKKLKDPLPNSW